MNTTENASTLAGVDLYKKTPAQIMALMIKKNDTANSALVQLCVMAYVLIIENSYKIKEAAENLEMTEVTVRVYSEKGRILALAATPVNAEKMYKQCSAFSLDELRALAAEVITQDDRAAYVQYKSVRAGAADRLGTKATPEAIDQLSNALIELGAVTPTQIKKQVADTATALNIALPKITREPKKGDAKADQVPTTTGALATLLEFEIDREAGSEGEEFTLTKKEAQELTASAKTAIRTLRRAGQMDYIADLAAFIDESMELIDA